MATNYTGLLQCIHDVQLYCAVKTGGQLSLDIFQTIAQGKIPWFSNNWPKLYPNFQNQALGDEILESALASFNSLILLYRIIDVSASDTANLLNSTETKGILSNMAPFFANISVTSVELNDAEQAYVDGEVSRVSNLGIKDFQNMRNYLRQQSALAAIKIGLGDPEGDVLLGVNGTAQRAAQPDDFDQIDNVIDLINIVDGVIFNFRNTEDKSPNLLAFAANNTDPTSGFNVDTGYYSSIAAPFEDTLEGMAQKYLGDKDRWYELVTVNNLQSPYVDAVGTKMPLVVPALQTSVVIGNLLTTSCPIGQKVSVGSARVRENTRTILSKIESNDGTITLFLSGEANLNVLTPAENAYVRIYAPHTVQPTSFLLIPLPVVTNLATTFVPKSDLLRSLDNALLAFGVDIARDFTTGDYLVDSSGNFVMSYGMDNVRQAIYFLLRTQVSELPFHLDYGINSQVGTLLVVGDEGDKIAALMQGSIAQDPRFTNVSIKRVRTNGTQVSIDMVVLIAGTTTAVPLSFVV